jgi:cellulose biosynthesis protein BcsQ
MTVIAIYNVKGGVGKTATAVNLSYLAAVEEKRILLCDLDPQGSASYYFRIKPKVKSGFKALVKGGKKLLAGIKATDYRNLDLLPADFSFRNLDLILEQVKHSKKRLRDSLGSLKDNYDLVFLDCPPNITLVSENIINAADFLIVPVIPTILARRTFGRLLEFLEKKGIPPADKVLGFFSMVEYRKKMHQNMMEGMTNQYQFLLKSQIPYLSLIEKMGIYREPVPARFPKSAAGRAYYILWKEIRRKLVKTKLW